MWILGIPNQDLTRNPKPDLNPKPNKNLIQNIIYIYIYVKCKVYILKYYELLGMSINILLNFICTIQNLYSFHQYIFFLNYCALKRYQYNKDNKIYMVS